MEKRNTNRPILLIGGILILVVVMLVVFTETDGNSKSLTQEQQLAALLSEIHAVGQVELYFHYEQSVKETNFLAVSQQQNVSGVIVVAEGAHDTNVKRLLKETIGNVLQIPTHRIQIVPMQMKEEEK